MAAIVLGGGGFIGQHLCASLAQAGHEVRAIGRSGPPADLPANVSWHQVDFSQTEQVADQVGSGDIVFHLIGGSTPHASNLAPTADITQTVVSTIDFVARIASRVRRLVFVSSGGTVYGIQPGILAETAPSRPTSAYGINKRTVEMYLDLYRHLHGLDYCALRVANPFGPKQLNRHQQGVIGAFMRAAVENTPVTVWGDGGIERDFIYIDDVVSAILAAAGSPNLPSRIYNIGSGRCRSILEVITTIEHLSGASLRKTFTPGRIEDVPSVRLDISLAGRELDWQPRCDWQAAMEQTFAWYQREYGGQSQASQIPQKGS